MIMHSYKLISNNEVVDICLFQWSSKTGIDVLLLPLLSKVFSYSINSNAISISISMV